jgi:hypothetical protein
MQEFSRNHMKIHPAAKLVSNRHSDITQSTLGLASYMRKEISDIKMNQYSPGWGKKLYLIGTGHTSPGVYTVFNRIEYQKY